MAEQFSGKRVLKILVVTGSNVILDLNSRDSSGIAAWGCGTFHRFDVPARILRVRIEVYSELKKKKEREGLIANINVR